MISLIKRDIGKPTKEFTIVAHDSLGGVDGASSFIILFQLLQELDTNLNDRKLDQENIARQKSVLTINIFDKVNEARKQRAQMVSTFSNYKFLFKTLAYYAENKSAFDKILIPNEKTSMKKNLSVTPLDSSQGPIMEEVEYVLAREQDNDQHAYIIDEIDQDRSYYNIYVN